MRVGSSSSVKIEDKQGSCSVCYKVGPGALREKPDSVK